VAPSTELRKWFKHDPKKWEVSVVGGLLSVARRHRAEGQEQGARSLNRRISNNQCRMSK
jgi:uncharacterized protein YeaO (DUF488 family)